MNTVEETVKTLSLETQRDNLLKIRLVKQGRIEMIEELFRHLEELARNELHALDLINEDLKNLNNQLDI